ncbi:MAG: phosphohistidine phosphatase SixA [gamma proteobacterium symbiont of Bathyaustriella thionipta]|nr:phosphohistidine phosphatase SixA [gamma proteobacterium symbiont of Bathyaustriella thionipta]MCU7950619.1 phosphohistidine phosphatase SixA [gamma proteobacterium symbiont of Bathyaustriella thionipta]MCU7954767.1 phosphohistidine phosphatase SixA [gamma proteobacterium symbiont of Bathyaustriella thionipta]MCU7957126.1 phosphohistidine phosphatase SixA [gamma proteobacterium symbiont of Bathyaustriella thionipta]MCU7968959.1 phosphohistidine phosphatase SixA [gamma proteobacterium symbion
MYIYQYIKPLEPGILRESRPDLIKGVSDIEHIGNFLKQADISVNRIIHSGKLRAKQTAEGLACQLESNIELETIELINPNDSPEIFARQIGNWQEDMLVVGHLPLLARLVAFLINGDEEASIVSFQPGSVVCLERSLEQQWVINWMIRPGLLSS